MTSLSAHPSSSFVKLLLLGDAKVGKTRSLVSLVAAGYKLYILDFDNLLGVLRNAILRDCPTLIDNVQYRSLRDTFKAGSDGKTVMEGTPKAWTNSIKMLNRWKYRDTDGAEIDFDEPESWGPDSILVIDSLSRWCDAAYDYHESVIPRGSQTDKFDGRAVYGNAQDDVEKQLSTLTSDTFPVNVIVICHGVYQPLPDGTTKIFPQGVGQKLSPKIPQYFPNYIRYTKRGERRTIQLTSDNMIDLASENSDALPKELDVETGLAKFFEILRSAPAKKVEGEPNPLRPKALTLARTK